MSAQATMATEMMVPTLRALKELGPRIERRAIDSGLEILGRAGLKVASFRDLTVRIPHDAGVALLENAVHVSGDPAFALRVGAGIKRGEFGLYDFLCSTAATLGQSIKLAARYLPLLHDGATVELAEEGGSAIWRHRLREDLLQSPSANEFVVSGFLFAAQRVIGLDTPPEELWFTHKMPAHREVYQELFRAPVRFGCECNGIVMLRVGLDLPLLGADPDLHSVLMRYADEQLQKLPRHQPFCDRVRDLVRERLAAGASFSDVARTLHMSHSTLGRRLSAEGSSYSEIVDQVRRQLAVELLARTELNIPEVAYRLGFAHRPAFHRAFKRWYGMSPLQHRERNTRSEFYRFYRNDRREPQPEPA